MTLPCERYRAIIQVRDFLRDLIDRTKTKRIPLAIRREARSRLKHFPMDFELRTLAKNNPRILEAPKDEK